MTRPLSLAVRGATFGVVLALSACATAPLHYYTLIPAGTAAPPPVNRAPLPFEVMPVNVPPQVDQPQLVVRYGGQAVSMLQTERWIAPLADEIRGAVAADLAGDLHSPDVSGLPGSHRPTLRVTLDIRRFDSVPDQYALIDAAWSLRLLPTPNGGQAGDTPDGAPAVLACTSQIRENVGVGYAALVQGHQLALAQLSRQIASAARVLAAGGAADCLSAS